MKNLILFTVLITAIVSLSGCSGASVKPEDKKTERIFTTIVSKKYIVYDGYFERNRDYQIGTVVAVIKDAAKYYKANGIKYFSIKSFNRVPFVITNVEDLVSYCYPDAKGFHSKTQHSVDTNLETDKCMLSYSLKRSNAGVSIGFQGYDENENPMLPKWSVDQVLNDKNVDKYVEALFDDLKLIGKNRKARFKIIDNTKKKLN